MYKREIKDLLIQDLFVDMSIEQANSDYAQEKSQSVAGQFDQNDSQDIIAQMLGDNLYYRNPNFNDIQILEQDYPKQAVVEPMHLEQIGPLNADVEVVHDQLLQDPPVNLVNQVDQVVPRRALRKSDFRNIPTLVYRSLRLICLKKIIWENSILEGVSIQNRSKYLKALKRYAYAYINNGTTAGNRTHIRLYFKGLTKQLQTDINKRKFGVNGCKYLRQYKEMLEIFEVQQIDIKIVIQNFNAQVLVVLSAALIHEEAYDRHGKLCNAESNLRYEIYYLDIFYRLLGNKQIPKQIDMRTFQYILSFKIETR